jgi:hypothetical protein
MFRPYDPVASCSVATGLVHLILEGREVGGSEISQLLHEDVPSLTHVPGPPWPPWPPWAEDLKGGFDE